MKTWLKIFLQTFLKIISIALFIPLLLSAAYRIRFALLVEPRQPYQCCLCNALLCEYPCLVDLETGDVVELRIFSSENTFSLVRLDYVQGIVDTGSVSAELNVPRMELLTPRLCKSCLNPFAPTGRYVLADFSKPGEPQLIYIHPATKQEFQRYTVSVSPSKSGWVTVLVQGSGQSQ